MSAPHRHALVDVDRMEKLELLAKTIVFYGEGLIHCEYEPGSVTVREIVGLARRLVREMED